jgi:hypothetical protein
MADNADRACAHERAPPARQTCTMLSVLVRDACSSPLVRRLGNQLGILRFLTVLDVPVPAESFCRALSFALAPEKVQDTFICELRVRLPVGQWLARRRKGKGPKAALSWSAAVRRIQGFIGPRRTQDAKSRKPPKAPSHPKSLAPPTRHTTTWPTYIVVPVIRQAVLAIGRL